MTFILIIVMRILNQIHSITKNFFVGIPLSLNFVKTIFFEIILKFKLDLSLEQYIIKISLIFDTMYLPTIRISDLQRIY